MNTDNDYDNDGNNIVHCPICLNVNCPSNNNLCYDCGRTLDGENCVAGGTHDNKRKCPEEDDFMKAVEAKNKHMTNKEELRERWEKKFIVNHGEFGKTLMLMNDLDEIVDFFWQEIEQAKRERDEELVEKFKAINLKVEPDDLNGYEVIDRVLQIIKRQDE